jgi:hypothetical protein
MPDFLERKLEAEYGKGNPRVYATMNAIGAMRGNKITAKGRAMEAKHKRDMGGIVAMGRAKKVKQ